MVRGMLEQGAACGQSLEAPGVFPAAPQPHLAPTHQRLAGGGVLTFWLERGEREDFHPVPPQAFIRTIKTMS